ncbi:MAG: D-2-hydroxyacid dehydrogenase [Verrucomicrobia bacterium]|nr:D-2-hydroxyacid dehydrogenase [Verrucomicrobiota bacterium]MCH8528618.1 D-2-hydroxyacid dehydrogenase [Kiritimatiellia bacterium]
MNSHTLCILDAFTTQAHDLNWNAFQSLGTLRVYDRTAPDEIEARAADADIVLTNKVVLSREVIARLPNLKLICLMSTGTNAVDLAAAADRGIPVCNVPSYSTASVAELVLAFMLAHGRAVEKHHASVARGDWVKCEDFCYMLTPQREWSGKTMGVVGFGEIGQAVARLGIALGMRVIAYTPHPAGKQDLGQAFVVLETLFRESDVVSLHCPLSSETEGLVNAQRLSWMKPDAFLVNTGRGGLVDEAALAEALKAGTIGGAGLDVLSTEPPKAENPLLSAPNTILAPHIGWATKEARQRLMNVLEANIRCFLKGAPQNVVNGVGV